MLDIDPGIVESVLAELRSDGMTEKGRSCRDARYRWIGRLDGE